jgi:pimeloyl-ACP methyl ester carboxylesterase
VRREPVTSRDRVAFPARLDGGPRNSFSESCVICLLHFDEFSVGCDPVSNLRSLQMPEQVRSATLMTARGPFAVLEAQPTRGVPHRKPAVLIPGYTGSKEDFLPILEPLAAAGRTVVAIDQRGQYQSPDATDRAGYSPEALAADTLAVVEAVGGEGGVHLVGHSLGGLIAREAVLIRAAGFLSLTLLGSGPGAIGGERSDALKQALAVLDPTDGAQPDDRTHLSRLVRQAWHERDELEARAQGTDEHVLGFLKERRLRTCPIQLIVMARYLLTCEDRTDELAQVVAAGLAALVVYGENDDAWLPAEQDQMGRRLGSERACIPGAAHSPAIDAPVTTAAILTNFWNGAERRQPTVHSCGRSERAKSADDTGPISASFRAVAQAAGPAPV